MWTLRKLKKRVLAVEAVDNTQATSAELAVTYVSSAYGDVTFVKSS